MKRLTQTLVLAGTLGAALWPIVGAHAQERPRDPAGIDVVVLVDVSNSMYSAPDVGNDRHRIRWDAVKLALDLLGPTDKMMVRRFNDNCPPRFHYDYTSNGKTFNYGDEILRMNQSLTQEGRLPVEADEFPREFLPLAINRVELEKRISRFNRQDDNGWLDFGGTKIIDALGSVVKELESGSPFRKKWIILLTDGLDTNYQNYIDDPTLKNALLPYEQRDESGKGIYPILILGLNLDAEGKTSSHQARDLLERVAYISDGSFKEVASSADLTDAFVRYIREIKGLWRDPPIEFLPSKKGQTQLATSQVVRGIIDLGILSYDELSQSQLDELAPEQRKYAVRPPKADVELEWDLPAGQTIAQPEVRTGKDQALYRYLYFGPELTNGNQLGSSPFADFQQMANLKLTMRGEDTKQRLLLLKSTADLFSLENPEASNAFRRHETMKILVRMKPSDYFTADQFSVSATISPCHDSGTTVAGTPFELKQTGSIFVVSQYLMDLPKSNEAQDSYQIAVSIVGKETNPSHALARSTRDLPPRIFVVKNSLKLKTLTDVTLTNDKLSEQIVVEVDDVKNVEEPIELNVLYTPPKSGDVSVADSSLAVSCIDGDYSTRKLTLKNGRAEIRLRLNKDNMPQRGVEYTPGIVTIWGPAGITMDDSEAKRTANVGLVLGLGTIALDSDTTLMEAGPVEIQSGPISVIPEPPNQPISNTQRIEVALFQVFPDGKQLKIPAAPTGEQSQDASADKDEPAAESEASKEPSAVDSATTFLADEIWLTTSATPAGQHPPQLKGLKLNEEFHIHLVHKHEKNPGKYEFLLEATGDGVASAVSRFSVSVNAPEIQVATQTETVFTHPGGEVSAEFHGWLTTAAKDSQYPVFIEAADPGMLVSFQSDTGSVEEARFQISCPCEARPVNLLSDANSRRPLRFEISVPENTKCGRYYSDFKLTGPDVIGTTVRLHVVVNRLEFDIAVPDEKTGKFVWQPANENESIQLENESLTQWLRIRNGLGERFSAVDDVVVDLEGSFMDQAGHPALLPTLANPELFRDGKSIRVKVVFQPTSTFNDEGRPYTIRVAARDSKKPIRVQKETFTFQVRLYKLRDVFRSSPTAPDAAHD